MLTRSAVAPTVVALLALHVGIAAAQTRAGAVPADRSVHCQREADGRCVCGPRRGTGRNIPCIPDEPIKQSAPCTPVPRIADDADIRNRIYDTTIQQNSAVYFNIFERSWYYGGVDRMLSQHAGTRDIRFFSAAAQVTDLFGVGAIEFPPGFLVNAPEARDLLKRVNGALLTHNMRVIKRLLETGCPVDPQAPANTQRLRGLEFDLAMVEYEQSEVERLLLAERGQPGFDLSRQDINRDLNLDGDILRPIGNLWTNTRPMQWAKRYHGVQRLDFMVKAHRVAIGKALVSQLHGLGYEAYQRQMSSRASPR